MTKHTSLVRLVSCTLIVAVSVFSPFGALSVRADATGSSASVVIGEGAWAGSSLSIADEWLELWNLGDATTSLAGWSLRGAGESGRTIFFFASSTVAPRGVYLISNYAASDAKSVLTIPPDVVTTTVSLSNSSLKIDLVDPSGAVIDTAGDGGSPPAGSSGAVKTTMIRDPSTGWISATSSRGMKPDLLDLGTPGFCDGCANAYNLPPTTSSSTTTTPYVFSTDPVQPTLDAQVSSSTDATSTDIAIEPSATTTDAVVTTSSTDAMDEGTATSEIVDVPETEPTSTEEAAAPNYAMLRLNEIAPNPASGKEWVEIVSLDASNRIPLDGCELHDAVGRILKIEGVTIDPATSSYAVIELASSRLNNDGDSVSFYDPDGRLVDAMRYGKTAKDVSWIRFPDRNGDWTASTIQTPGASNVPTPPIVVNAPTAASPSTTSTDAPPDPPSTVAQPKIAPPVKKVVARKTTKPTVPTVAHTDPSASSNVVSTIPAKQAKPAPKKKTAASPKPKTSPIIRLSFDMRTSDDYGNLRVQLHGTVGSQPGLVPNHAFVLQTPDGRGLLVSVPATRKLPAMGTDLSVVGTLHFSGDNIPSLKVGSKDGWSRPVTSTEPIVPRLVDLTAPSAEDAWSLIEVTGTVMDVSGQTVRLDLADAQVNMVIRRAVNYRAKRLVAGDVLRVKGIIDTSTDVPRILPRSADDIVLVRHAPTKNDLAAQTAARSPSLPPWMPVGAAAGAVGAVEGAKHLHRRKRQKDLERKLATLTTSV